MDHDFIFFASRMNRDLHTALKVGLTWPKRLRVAIDVVEGIRFLHAQVRKSGEFYRDDLLIHILYPMIENRV